MRRKMKKIEMSLLDAILERFELLRTDADQSVMDAVKQESDRAVIAKTKRGWSVKEGRRVLGSGKTEESAWASAALNLLGIDR